MKITIILLTALMLAPIPAYACMGGQSLVFIVISVSIGLIGLFVFAANLFLRSADQPVISEKADTAILVLNFPVAAYISALSMRASGTPGGDWRCMFADYLPGQIVFHIGLPVALSGLSLFAYSRVRGTSHPSFRVLCLWVVFGLWGTVVASLVANALAENAGPSYWRALHYGNIVMLCLSVLVMPKIGQRIHSGLAFIAVFLSFILSGVIFANIFRLVA